MSAMNAAFEQYLANNIVEDPGASGTINCIKSPGLCNLSSLTAETRTLARPTKSGAILTLHMLLDTGDITLTVTGGLNEDGDTTFVFSDEGQFLTLQSFQTKASPPVYFWRKISDYTVGNLDPADLVVLEAFSGLTSTVDEINNSTDISNRLVSPASSVTAVTVPVTNSDRTYLLTPTASLTVTLPAMSGSGAKYKFVQGTTLSSTTTKFVATGAHLFGCVPMITDTGAGTLFTMVGANGATGSTNISLNGADLGGRKGDWIQIEDVASSIGLVSGQLNGSGTESTPFS